MGRLLAALILVFAATQSYATCRLALALALDVSGSVDAREYRLQIDGLANALVRDDVVQAFLASPNSHVDLFVFEWSSEQDQRTIVPWQTIESAADLQGVASRLRSTNRAGMSPETALGTAMIAGWQALDTQAQCARRVLDVSGDGKSNVGPRPRSVSVPGIVINGLVIGADPRSANDTRQAELGELVAYYRAEVIRGPGAFVEIALGFEDYEAAMARKLLRELITLIVGKNSAKAVVFPPIHARLGERR